MDELLLDEENEGPSKKKKKARKLTKVPSKSDFEEDKKEFAIKLEFWWKNLFFKFIKD